MPINVSERETMLDEQTVAVMTECSVGSIEGKLRFPQVLEKLAAIGVESYHADLYRQEKTYYLPSGESHAEELAFGDYQVADAFDMSGVRRALLRVQQQQTSYLEFIEEIAVSGVAHYWVYIGGRRAIYASRRGEEWVEWFPLP
ncbi:DUF1398 family protein [Alloacidobacterium dinghuense]|uniref:DUF1398 family protein n=1 Tax=Alloacidobacterium dinghuense TaxID=2763107 RepID=A0A7G8BIV3_9BACT|nr:DUF1398 family protein [Alloacidobacterium dinghuense]QNI32473.1 DUF1398 family protein [Alloacidobacterium dinghuense]